MKKDMYIWQVLGYNSLVSQTNHNMKSITQDEFTDLLLSAYAVVVNNEYLQYIGHDDQDRLYIADHDMQSLTYLDKIDDIRIEDNTILFNYFGEHMILHLLDVKQLS
jgi:hypothetical protein